MSQVADQEAKEHINEVFDRSRNEVLKERGLDLLLIKNYDIVKIPTLAAYDLVVIDYYDEDACLHLLQEIRSSVYEEIYLKPVFILAYESKVSPVHEALADGILRDRSLGSHYVAIEHIIKANEKVLEVDSDFKGRKILLRLIRLLYTRDASLEPVATVRSHMGYSYPFLDAHIAKKDYQEVLDIMEAGVSRGFLSTDFVDIAHLCSQCLSGFINYRETCPKCGSRNHESQHTIHHFVCGFVGPESDFFQDQKMVCPKCDRQLRHIGVDYDKPSLISECENGHVFQEADMKTFCFNCQDENELSNLIDYRLHQFALTASGANVAISGADKKKRKQKDLEGFVSLSVFKTFLRIEMERQKSYKNKGTLTYINLVLSPTTLKKHQDDFDELGYEIAKVVKSQLKSTEIVSFINEDVFLIISPETPKENASERYTALKNKLLSYIVNNLNGSEADKIFVESFEMDDNDEKTSLLTRVNEKINIF